MIRIFKPPTAPAILRNRGRRTTLHDKTLYEKSPDEYNRGNKKFDFDSGVYGAKSVKKALRKAQHDKCCFCESKVTHVAYGDVEHFRPKGGYRQNKNDELGRPGYYWLAYEWTNLFFSCQLCNQRYKRNLFPLKVPDNRALCHHDEITAEEPLFLNPAQAEPREHIGFRKEYCYAADDSRIGQMTIEALGLNREELVEMRRDRLREFKIINSIRELLATAISDCERDGTPIPTGFPKQLKSLDAEIERLQQDSTEFAAMARSFFE